MNVTLGKTDLKSKSTLSYVLILGIALLIGYFTIYKSIIGESEIGAPEAFMLMLAALAIGEVVSIKTKALIPSIFVTATIFIIGFWTIFPKDILQIGGIGPSLPGLFVMIMVTHLGTMLDKDEFIAQWKTVVVTIKINTYMKREELKLFPIFLLVQNLKLKLVRSK